jgi:hypothetical protein
LKILRAINNLHQGEKMDQNDEGHTTVPIVFESLEDTPRPIPKERISLVKLYIKRGTEFAVNVENEGTVTIIMKRRPETYELEFTSTCDPTFAKLPMATFTTNTCNLDSPKLSELADKLMKNILGETARLELKLKFAEDGAETNSVEVSIIAGQYKANIIVGLVEILHYVGETGPADSK